MGLGLRRAAALTALAAFAALAAGGCGSVVPAPTPSPMPSVVASPSGVASPSVAPPTGEDPEIDHTLLEHLPDTVDGLAVVAEDSGVAEAAADPAIARNATALAGAIVVDPATEEFAYAAVTRLREGVMSEEFYRSWRDSFDAEACSRAGGVAGHAEAEIGGREVFIGSCKEAVRTYHVWLGGSGVLVSVSAVGDRRLGEQLVRGLLD